MNRTMPEWLQWARRLLAPKNRAQLALCLGAAAMLLLFLSELAIPQNRTPAQSKESSADFAQSYQQELESRLEALIGQVQGAGKTTVMITLESGEETIYAMDTLTGQAQSQKTHVMLEDGSALEETVCLPTVFGVAVVCEGGGDIRVAARITELVGALLDVPSNRICVEQRRS